MIGWRRKVEGGGFEEGPFTGKPCLDEGEKRKTGDATHASLKEGEGGEGRCL